MKEEDISHFNRTEQNESGSQRQKKSAVKEEENYDENSRDGKFLNYKFMKHKTHFSFLFGPRLAPITIIIIFSSVLHESQEEPKMREKNVNIAEQRSTV